MYKHNAKREFAIQTLTLFNKTFSSVFLSYTFLSSPAPCLQVPTHYIYAVLFGLANTYLRMTGGLSST